MDDLTSSMTKEFVMVNKDSIEIATDAAEVDQITDLKGVALAVPWILQKCVAGDSNNLLTEISECQYKLLLLTYAVAVEDSKLIENVLHFLTLKETSSNDEEWDAFQELLKNRFEFSAPLLFNILSHAVDYSVIAETPNSQSSLALPESFIRVMTICGKGRGLIHIAVSQDATEVLNILLKHGLNVNETNDAGETPLHIASRKGHSKSVEILLDHGAWHFALNDEALSPLYLAVQNLHVDSSELLLKRTVNINVIFPGRNSLLRTAVEANCAPLVKLLTSRGACIVSEYEDESTVLHYAVTNGYKEIAELLVTSDSFSIKIKNNSGHYPLHIAAINGNVGMIELLLAHGANINERDSKMSTPLFLAIMNMHSAAVHLLISEGADVGHTNVKGDTPLSLAVSLEDASLIKLLVAAGAKNLNSSQFPSSFIKENSYFLYSAIKKGNIDVLKALIDCGINVNPQYSPLEKSLTPLMAAILTDKNEIINILLDSGADVKKLDGDSRSALHIVATLGNVEIADKLIKKGADLNIIDSKKYTPLHYAVVSDNLPMVKFLREEGARMYENTADKVINIFKLAKSEKVKDYLQTPFTDNRQVVCI